jgi:hypothetical protein
VDDSGRPADAPIEMQMILDLGSATDPSIDAVFRSTELKSIGRFLFI